jgi:ATP:ADP antiporter, AAA family
VTDEIPAARKGLIDRALSLAADVHAGEGLTALLMAANGFLLLAAYYAIRPLRGALLLPVEITLPGGTVLPGPQINSYVGAILAALFLVIVPLYGAFASRVNRIRLINTVTVFFVLNLVGFFVLAGTGAYPTALGIGFVLWVGIFNLMVVAQFWSFANDLYTPDQGKRLFAIVGFGGSIGAAAGAYLTSVLIPRFGTSPMMLISCAELLLALLITNVIHARDGRRPRPDRVQNRAAEQALGTEGGFQLILRHRYLLFIGLLTLTVQIVNTNGNYLLNESVAQMARGVVASGNTGGLSERDIIGSFMADVDFWQNVLSMLIQFFLVSRIFKYLGISGALFVLPTLAFMSYGLFALAPVLAFIRLTKIAENATDYSLQNTLRRALFLPTSREAKYKALQAVETFFWRAGDMLSAVVVFVVVQWLALSIRQYAAVNIALVLVWFVVAAVLARENRRLTEAAGSASLPASESKA